jgi:hypothetical protein
MNKTANVNTRRMILPVATLDFQPGTFDGNGNSNGADGIARGVVVAVVAAAGNGDEKDRVTRLIDGILTRNCIRRLKRDAHEDDSARIGKRNTDEVIKACCRKNYE